MLNMICKLDKDLDLPEISSFRSNVLGRKLKIHDLIILDVEDDL